ncbi:hypothetical protein CQA53_10385 [Helicobacter didelphidarum]|uniref:Fungal lipase-type domain-containing protein n=1 Tax=Helicobacter didelphidarum TaxID=2040648 RepID=A0A3D8I7X2_9HELI|nr:DUF2974 domain-containing protein [Helicobacter didelphidarum]RDU61270.1 hypothetical protein CQA53_10385 [Helicobacter didelphidarum]
MSNKRQIQKLRDNAEWAWAAYGYFNLIGKRFEKKILKDIDRESTPIITQTDILDITYNKYIAVELNPHKQDDEIQVGKLKGEFSPNQAKRFFERYDLLLHQPNTSSGFSATLFEDLGEIDKSTGKRKEVPKDSKYILAFRGTEMSSDKIKATLKDFYEDFLLGTNQIPEQYFDLIHFVETKIKPKIYDTSSQSYPKMMIVGHSLGGFLAQMCALSLCDNKNEANINEVYTYNNIKPKPPKELQCYL